MVHFNGTDYRSHTSCISEAQKYQGHLYKEKGMRGKGAKRVSIHQDADSQAMVPRRAYVEDVAEGDDMQAVAVIDVPPKAPSPPPASGPMNELPDSVNVFDFLVDENATNGNAAPGAAQERTMVEHPMYYGNGNMYYPPYAAAPPMVYMQHGFSYGNAPLPPSFDRYDSYQDLKDAQPSPIPVPATYVTPAPKEQRKEKSDKHVSISEKKRKRHHVEELNLSSTTKRPTSKDEPMTDAPNSRDSRTPLHTGLTGGLSKLVTDPEFYADRIEAGPTPISPLKRSRREEDAKKDRRKSSYAAYGGTTTTTSRSSSSKHHDEKHYRSRSLERGKYHDDRQRRRSSAERRYHDDKYRQRRSRYDSMSSEDKPHRKHVKAIEYPDRPSSVQPSNSNQLVSYTTRADLFLSFINKGPDSERVCSINKVLKRYHR